MYAFHENGLLLHFKHHFWSNNTRSRREERERNKEGAEVNDAMISNMHSYADKQSAKLYFAVFFLAKSNIFDSFSTRNIVYLQQLSIGHTPKA